LSARRAGDRQYDDREPDEEDKLSEDAGVPADDRDGRTFSGARIPAHEGRQREDESRHPAQLSPDANQPWSPRGHEVHSSPASRRQSRLGGLGLDQVGALHVVLGLAASDAEQVLDLDPDGDREDKAAQQQPAEDEPEANARQAPLVPACDLRVAFRAMDSVGAADRDRVEGRRLIELGWRPRWLSHANSLVRSATQNAVPLPPSGY